MAVWSVRGQWSVNEDHSVFHYIGILTSNDQRKRDRPEIECECGVTKSVLFRYALFPSLPSTLQ